MLQTIASILLSLSLNGHYVAANDTSLVVQNPSRERQPAVELAMACPLSYRHSAKELAQLTR
jgi:hypothetical protein